ncbi:hypothetical protein [Palaeococcus ferrophilus]|uniref:hypothetical protein n=1 Tax=Palaeococcus ferrophilus TaxID=83868 RepID=UPI0012F90E2F|nr:hypothetical protein [Palaeococcus ferrophilus]
MNYFKKIQNMTEDIMKDVSFSKVYRAYGVWSLLKLILAPLLVVFLFAFNSSGLNLENKLVILIFGFLIYSVVWFLIFNLIVLSTLKRLSTSPVGTLNLENLGKICNSSYFVFILSALNVLAIIVILIASSWIYSRYNTRGIWGSTIILESLLQFLLPMILFRGKMYLKDIKSKFLFFVTLFIITIASIWQAVLFASYFLETKDTPLKQMIILFVLILEFLFIVSSIIQAEKKLTALVWKLNLIEKSIIRLPWVEISKDGNTYARGFLFDPFDDRYLVLKKGECYMAIPWKDLKMDMITVCGDTLYALPENTEER